MLSHFELSFVVRWCQIAVTREWQPRGDVDSTSDAGQDRGESHQRTGFPTDSGWDMPCSVGFGVSAA